MPRIASARSAGPGNRTGPHGDGWRGLPWRPTRRTTPPCLTAGWGETQAEPSRFRPTSAFRQSDKLLVRVRPTGQTYETSLAAPSGTSLQGNSAEAIVETPELISGNGEESQPPLSDFLNSPVAFDDVSATYSNGSAASLSSAQSIGMWTNNNDPPGVSGSVQEAYGSIQRSSDSVTVTENDYWGGPTTPSVGNVVAVGDFNDDGYSDLAYFNSGTSTTTLQLLNGATEVGGGQITNRPFEGLAGWVPVAAGDFTDNGYSDLVYYNSTLVETEVQFLNGTTATGAVKLRTAHLNSIRAGALSVSAISTMMDTAT
jgi:hypothetical protein